MWVCVYEHTCGEVGWGGGVTGGGRWTAEQSNLVVSSYQKRKQVQSISVHPFQEGENILRCSLDLIMAAASGHWAGGEGLAPSQHLQWTVQIICVVSSRIKCYPLNKLLVHGHFLTWKWNFLNSIQISDHWLFFFLLICHPLFQDNTINYLGKYIEKLVYGKIFLVHVKERTVLGWMFLPGHQSIIRNQF